MATRKFSVTLLAVVATHNPNRGVEPKMVKYDYVKTQREDVRPIAKKASLWPHLLSLYPDFDEYQARTDRNIPVPAF